MKRASKSFRFVIVILLMFTLSFPMGFNVYAATDGTEATSNSGITLEQDQGDPGNPEPQIQDSYETPGPAVMTEGGDGTDPPDIVSEEELPDIISEQGDKPLLRISQLDTQNLAIESVEVVNGGAEQTRNRTYIYQVAPDTAYYTLLRSASMTDERIFTVKTTVTYDQLGIEDFSEFDSDKLNWTYGGDDLSDWRIYNPESGEFDSETSAIYLISQDATDIVGEVVEITAEIRFDEFYPILEDYTVNIPYDGFTAVKKEGFRSSIRYGDPIGTYELTVSYDETDLAGADITLNLYDSFHTWDQIDAEARALQELCEGNNIINGRYVSVAPLYTNTADETDRSIWNVVIAKDEQSIDDYFNETKPLMEYNPETLKAELSRADAVESGYHKIPLYFNNVHPDETPGADANLALINTFIYGDELSYQTQIDSVHIDKGTGYDGYTVEGRENLTSQVDFTVDEILSKFILVFNITENPYGKANLVRTNDYGFDLNRDAAYQTQPEAIALTQDLVKWDSLSMLEYHGYMDGLLIEPCTGPHDPNYEYDLYQQMMRDQGNAIGKAMIGSTAYYQYLMPATDWNDGWDDGAPIYGPMFAMLFGTMGYTLEIPYSTQDSVEACYNAGLALAYDSLDNRIKYFRNKLDYKERCINNEDNLNVDQYLINPYTGDKVGRPRVDGQSFFPEYYVIPVDPINQRNPLEAYKMLQLLERNGIDLKITNSQITYGNKKFPAGTYVIDMHQQGRGFVNSMLSEGYDASDFAAIYAELVINHPDMRNFDCTSIFEPDVFSGKTKTVADVAVPPTSISGASEQVVIQNDNIDAIRLVNRLLDEDKEVSMLTEDFGKAEKGDFVVDRNDLTGNNDLLVFGFSLTGMPNFIQEIQEPNFAIYGYEDHSRFVLDMLEFTGDYVYNPESIPEDANAIVDFDWGIDASEALEEGIGYIGIGYYALGSILDGELLPGFDCFIPDEETWEPYYEGLVRADYSGDSLVTTNYDRTDAAYVMNGTYITGIPENGEALITIDNNDDFYRAGWYPEHDVLKGNMLAVSGYAEGSPEMFRASEAEGAPVVLFANNIFSKAHAQHTYNMFANALYLMASDIDLNTGGKPSIEASPASQEIPVTSLTVNLTFKGDRAGTEDVEVSGQKYKVTSSATEPLYAEGASGWTASATTEAIALPAAAGTYYIHAYAENTNAEITQIVFGPYCIGASGGEDDIDHHDHHGSGGGSTTPPAPTTTEPAITSPSFTDINGHWAEPSIEFVVGRGLFSGISDTLFAPDATMTKGMLVTVLGRAFGLNTDLYSQSSMPSDVSSSAYYAPYVAWAFENKIVSGSGDGLFSPDKPVTRGEMAVIIANFLKFIGKGAAGSGALNYADAGEIPDWGLDAVRFNTENGLMTGTSGNNFEFDGLSTRAQVAVVMERLLKLMEQ